MASGCEGEWVIYHAHSKFPPPDSVSKIYFIWMKRWGKRCAEYFIWIGWLLGLRWQWRICRFANLLICWLRGCWWDYSKFSPPANASKIYFIWMQRRGKRLVENFILIGWLFGMRQQLLKQVQHDWRIEHQGCFFQNTFFSKEAFIEPVIPNLFRNLPKRVEKGLDVSAFHSNS